MCLILYYSTKSEQFQLYDNYFNLVALLGKAFHHRWAKDTTSERKDGRSSFPAAQIIDK